MLRRITIDGTKVNQYIMGRISGIIYVLARESEKGGFPWEKPAGSANWTVTLNCTMEEYYNVVMTVNQLYPGVILNEEKLN